MKLYFKNKYDEEIFLGDFENKEEAYKEINRFLDDHQYHSYYWNANYYPNMIVIDVGSWTEFFHLYY